MQPTKRALETPELPLCKRACNNNERTPEWLFALFKRISEEPPSELVNNANLLLENFGPCFVELGSSIEENIFLKKISIAAAFLSGRKKEIVKEHLPLASYTCRAIGPFLITSPQTFFSDDNTVRIAPDYKIPYSIQSKNLNCDSPSFLHQAMDLLIKGTTSLELFSLNCKEMKFEPKSLDLSKHDILLVDSNTFGFDSHIDIAYEKKSVTLYYTNAETLLQEKVEFTADPEWLDVLKTSINQKCVSSIHATKEGLYFFHYRGSFATYLLLLKNDSFKNPSARIWHSLPRGPSFRTSPPIFRDEAIYSLSIVETEEAKNRSLTVSSFNCNKKGWQEELFNMKKLNQLSLYVEYSISFGPYIAFPGYLGPHCSLFFYHTEKKSLDCHSLEIPSSHTVRKILSFHSEKTHLVLIVKEEFLVGEEGTFDIKPFSYIVSGVPTFWSKPLGEGCYKGGKILKGEVMHGEGTGGDGVQFSLETYEYSGSI